MDEQKQKQFQAKALLGQGMNMLGKTSRNLTESLLNFLPNLLFQIHPMGLIGSVTVLFWPSAQGYLFALLVIVLLLIVGIGPMAVPLTTGRQINVDRLQGGHIHKRARMPACRTDKNQLLDRLAGSGGNQWHSKTVEKPSFGGDFAPVVFAFDQARTLDTNIVTYSHRKAINHLYTFQIQVFKSGGQVVKQTFQPTCQAYLSSRANGDSNPICLSSECLVFHSYTVGPPLAYHKRNQPLPKR